MGDKITLRPNTGVNPTFVGRGSFIAHPDILPIFLGQFWPGVLTFNYNGIANMLIDLVAGPYFEGLRQYGYVGPTKVRPAVVDNTPFNVSLPAAAPGVSQSLIIANAVRSYITGLLDDDRIDNVDDNHELVVVVFLDPSIPVPMDTNQSGVQSFVNGANSKIEEFEFLDDNTLFEWAWINTSSGNIDNVSQIVSHELNEIISDPFGSGWFQTSPTPSPGSGQIGDVCNQNAIVNGISVRTYWSVSDNACIVTTSKTRQLFANFSLDTHEPTEGPTKQGYEDLPWICGGAQYFNYHEVTYLNVINIGADFRGYESPRVTYFVNGQLVKVGNDFIEIPTIWDEPRSNPFFPDLSTKPTKTTLKTFLPNDASSSLKIAVGPNSGNFALVVDVKVIESFDDESIGGGSTRRNRRLHPNFANQEIFWDKDHDDALSNCDKIMNRKAGGGGIRALMRLADPGDPPEFAKLLEIAVTDSSPTRSEKLDRVAKMVEDSRPDLSKALSALSLRSKGL
jgi:hypothetical protein